MKRLTFIDNLKIFLITLVILHHIVIAYGASGGFPIIEGASDAISSIILTIFTAINQSFFMSLFFLLSGYFLVGSLERKGKLKFMKGRLVKLGIPLITYPILIAPLIDYLVLTYKNKSVPLLSLFKLNWNIGPMWFVEALLIFSLIYMIIKPKQTIFKNKFPTDKSIILTIITLALLTFLVRIVYPVDTYWHVFQLGQFVNYIFAFYIGTVAFNNNWFEHLKETQSKLWKRIAIASMIFLPVMMGVGIMLTGKADPTPYLGTFRWEALLFAFWDTFAFMSIIIALLFIFKEKYYKENKLTKFASPNYYGAYIFHTLIVVAFVLLLKNLAVPSLIKILIVSTLSIPLSFIVTNLLKKIPLINKVLG